MLLVPAIAVDVANASVIASVKARFWLIFDMDLIILLPYKFTYVAVPALIITNEYISRYKH